MANPVQRVRYFDGEYLQSYDFTDDQSYHIAMRRQMNVRLHLHGIVYGLAIVMDQDSVLPNGPFFFSVEPGLAIDHTGREILVPAPYSLSNILTGPGLSPGWYEVWICYQENQTGLPAAGYLDCNVQGQNTRYQETFQIVLNKQGNAAPACGGVRLGTVDIQDEGPLGREITDSNNLGRTYVGIRAQRLIAPDQETDQFDITAINTTVPDKLLPGYLDVYPGTFHRGNVIVKKNEVIGDDFVLDSSKDPNVPGSISSTGNLKVTGDCFINGGLYVFVSGKCFSLQQVIQSLTPFDLQMGTVLIDTSAAVAFPGVSPNAHTDTTSAISVPSSLASVSKANVLLSISSIGWRSANDLQTKWNADTDGFIFKVVPVVPAISNPINLSIQWTVGPVVSPSGLLPITSLVVNYIVVFQP